MLDGVSKSVALKAVIDANVLACLPDEQICDLFELLSAEVIFRAVQAPPTRCGLCLRPAERRRLCLRHHDLLMQALDLFSDGPSFGVSSPQA